MSGKLTVALLTQVPDMFLGFPDDAGHSLAANRCQEGRARPAAPRAPHGLEDLNQSYDIELTYTSNAIEGITLTAAETRMVIEHGVTIGGKPLKDHLEAIDHFAALRYVRGLARQAVPLREPDAAGRYANQARFVETDSGRHHFPSPAEVPAPMGDFAQWPGGAAANPETAFAAHRRPVEIHPFNDGNGRTARLLMNLVLLRGDYPPVAVRPEDRPAYIDTLQDAQAGRGGERLDRLLYERLDATLEE
jgi:Fic family protein